MDAKDIRILMGIVGNVISFLISLSQMSKFKQACKEKSVPDDFHQYRHVVMVVKCSLWVLYGLPFVQRDSILVTTSNGIGFIIEVIHVIAFLIYSDEEDSRGNTDAFLILGGSFVGIIWCTVWVCEPFLARRKLIGIVCNVFTIAMYSCLAMDQMCPPKGYWYMPFWSTFASFINAGIWTAYSLIYKTDIYILITNGLGTLACTSHLVVHACYMLCKLCRGVKIVKSNKINEVLIGTWVNSTH